MEFDCIAYLFSFVPIKSLAQGESAYLLAVFELHRNILK